MTQVTRLVTRVPTSNRATSPRDPCSSEVVLGSPVAKGQGLVGGGPSVPLEAIRSTQDGRSIADGPARAVLACSESRAG
jgi:hypothetical protein